MSQPIPWISPAQALQRFADFIAKSADELDDRFLRNAEQAANIACSQIRSIMKLRGWVPAQIETWSDRVYYATELAGFFCAVRSAGLASYDMTAAREMDVRVYLRESPELSVDGEPVAPSIDATVGGAATGTLTAVTEANRDDLGLFRVWNWQR
jgi:hypothetical protein